MALLSTSTYNRLAKSFDSANIILINEQGEFVRSKALVNLGRTKSKINTRWEFDESNNIHPFTHASIVIKNKHVLTSAIRPIERALFGYLDIQYESDD